MRYKKITSKNLISLGRERACADHMGVVSLCVEGDAIIIRPYREGDEEDCTIAIKSLDSRGRLTLPSALLERTEIDRVTEVEVHRDGSISLRPSEKCRDCPYRV